MTSHIIGYIYSQLGKQRDRHTVENCFKRAAFLVLCLKSPVLLRKKKLLAATIATAATADLNVNSAAARKEASAAAAVAATSPFLFSPIGT